MKLRRKYIVIAGAVLVVVVAAGLGLTAARRMSGPREEKRLKVLAKRAVNGHYVKVDDQDKLIYAGIRAPYENEPLYEEARQRNAELVVGQELRLRFDQDRIRDDEGRLIAYAFIDEFFVNAALVQEGLAYVRLTPETQRYADMLLAAQQAARAAGQGVWSNVGPSDEATYVADPKHGDFHRPTCEAVGRIKPERRLELANKDAAFDAGFAPCNKCRP